MRETSDYKFEFEDDKYRYYTNISTEILDKHCVSNSVNAPKLFNYKCYILENKENGKRIYVLYNNKGEPVADSYQLDGMGIKIDMMRVMKKKREKKYE